MKSLKKPDVRFSIDAIKSPALFLGAALLLIGIGSWLVNGFDTLTRVVLAVGVLLIGVFVAIDPEDVWGRMTAPGALYSGNTLLLAGAVIGVLGLANVVAVNRHQRWDLTSNKQYSLSEQTVNVINDLPQPVSITAFYQDDEGRREAQDLLTEYQARSGGKVGVEFVDPDREPARAQLAGIKEYRTTVVTMGDRRQTVTGSRESDFTTGLLRLMSPTQKKIYFTIGHNERKIDGFEQESFGQLKTSLESDNYLVDTLLLTNTLEVPADAGLVVIAQPRNPFSEEEKQAISTYLDNGGKLMLLTQPHLPPSQPQVPLSDLVSKWNVEIGSAVVAEGNPQFALPGEPLAPAVARYPNHKITEGLGVAVFPTTTYINAPSGSPRDATITNILQTTDRSWAETDPQQLRFDEGIDAKGPLNIGVAIDATPANAPPSAGQSDAPQKKTRVVIFGDADFASNRFSTMAPGNRDLFLNAANWLAEEEQLIAIRPKERDTRTLFMSQAQQNLVLFSSTLFLPLIVLGIGGFVWWGRR